jgi:toxin FitB
MYLLDTNVLSALRRPELAPISLTRWAASVAVDALYVSAISIYEIDLGIRRMERRDTAQGDILRRWFLGAIMDHFQGRILPVDADIARECAKLQVPLPRPERDSFIAATALVRGLTVVTRNQRDFENTGVSILNPWVDVT